MISILLLAASCFLAPPALAAQARLPAADRDGPLHPEGCTATDTEDRANFGPGGNPLPHKYTTYKGLDEILGVPTKYKSTCDYGCGTTKEFGALDKDVVVDKTTQGPWTL